MWVPCSCKAIASIQADADHTGAIAANKKHLSNEPPHHWELLAPYGFVRVVHKSLVVNLAQVERVSGNQVYLKQGDRVPIGRAYKEAFMGMFLKG